MARFRNTPSSPSHPRRDRLSEFDPRSGGISDRITGAPFPSSAELEPSELESAELESAELESAELEPAEIESARADAGAADSTKLARRFRADGLRRESPPQAPTSLSRRTAEGTGPRDRLWLEGVRSLSDPELIAVLLGTGTAGRSALAIASELVEQIGGLRELADAHPTELAGFGGIGEAKAARLVAAIEVGRRVGGLPWRRGDLFLGAKQIFEHYAPRLRDERREYFIAAYLDVRHRLIGERVISCGSLVASIVHPREVFRTAIRSAAAGLVVVHNHPSGDPTPSTEDWAVTDRLRRCGETLGIELLDHVVIGDRSWTSLREECHPARCDR